MKRNPFVRVKRSFESLRKNQRGNVLIAAAVSLPALIGAAGLGTDTVQWYLWKRQMQQAADAAALAGAYALSQNQTFAQAEAAARASFATNLSFSPTEDDVTPFTNAKYGDGAVSVKLAYQRELPFSSMFMSSGPEIMSTATAAVLVNDSSNNCIITTATDGAGIIADGGSVTMDCGATTNSKHEQAAIIDNGFRVTSVSAVGGISGTAAEGTQLKPFSISQDDPLAYLPDVVVPNPCNNKIDNFGTYSPGCYSRIKVAGNGEVKLSPGTYIIDGDVDLTGTASLVGEGVTLILSDRGNFKMTGDQFLKLTAPQTGTYAGVIIYQDRDAPTESKDFENDNGNYKYLNKFTGSAGSVLQGAIYMPNQGVRYSGSAGVDASCLRIVAKSVAFKGSPNIKSTCSANSGIPTWNSKVVRLVPYVSNS